MTNSFFKKNQFYQKKVGIFVPHNDDEMNIAGGLIPILLSQQADFKIIFLCNSDYSNRGETRLHESIKALETLGVHNVLEKISLLGYPEQHYNEKDHYYMNHDGTWVSHNGYCTTYNLKGTVSYDWSQSQEHRPLTQESLVKTLCDLCFKERFDYYVVIDFDSHCDHRALSLAFEKSMGVILKKLKYYHPVIYKAFAYPTCYLGKADFNVAHNASTCFSTEPFSLNKMQNPYYMWDNRVRFPLLPRERNTCLWKNSIYRALTKYHTQLILRKRKSIINNDIVYFQRNTNNLSLQAYITVSSGDATYLNDFLFFDCLDIMKGKERLPELAQCYWTPQQHDLLKKIHFRWDSPKNISQLVIYQSLESQINKIEITVNGHTKVENLTRLATEIILEEENVMELEIKIVDYVENQIGIAEIEILERITSSNELIKLCYNEDFLYSYNGKVDLEKLKVYYYNGLQSRYLLRDEYILETTSKYIRVHLANNVKIYDEIPISRHSILKSFYSKITIFLNFIVFKWDESIIRVQNKIKRVITHDDRI